MTRPIQGVKDPSSDALCFSQRSIRRHYGKYVKARRSICALTYIIGLKSRLPAIRIPLHGALADEQSMPELRELRAIRPFFAPLKLHGRNPSDKQSQCLVALQARLYA